ncbi:hypothetical protein AtubIFM55763_010624 [Aspergillus tubingensis]|uniref:VOC domain-containing protein n=1 Tax=Aspergillus tubingensis TaxID=5068 RepID=A0A9W6EI55_ASPTU|nr:hypothetical protein AtubIFM54640_010236 [Aspergillus tubingensis]GLA78135.1 hypothetical protein AtubIFM55763_010624 [Aspergillus tubingensis]GLA80743.1 hypothetical protein AtubIFM56815_001575 [Aspergillus tubingensis]GLB22598.1 hypothetical protein AtubIFM61612_003172 [Aspergillus tubingensis]
MHLYLGKELINHAFSLGANPKTSHVHHCSFEVHDYNTQQLGHHWLVKNGYQPASGVGHHVLGSQIFDHWWDVSGILVEHYADGDLVDAETPIGYVPVGPDSFAIWGPGLLATFPE